MTDVSRVNWCKNPIGGGTPPLWGFAPIARRARAGQGGLAYGLAEACLFSSHAMHARSPLRYIGVVTSAGWLRNHNMQCRLRYNGYATIACHVDGVITFTQTYNPKLIANMPNHRFDENSYITKPPDLMKCHINRQKTQFLGGGYPPFGGQKTPF